MTDRIILDDQIRDTIKQFAQVGATTGHADRSGNLRQLIQGGKKIVITTVQKFRFILDDIGNEHRDRRFAIIIDEAHSSQGADTVRHEAFHSYTMKQAIQRASFWMCSQATRRSTAIAG